MDRMKGLSWSGLFAGSCAGGKLVGTRLSPIDAALHFPFVALYRLRLIQATLAAQSIRSTISISCFNCIGRKIATCNWHSRAATRPLYQGQLEYGQALEKSTPTSHHEPRDIRDSACEPLRRFQHYYPSTKGEFIPGEIIARKHQGADDAIGNCMLLL